jgi:hypothetical protein
MTGFWALIPKNGNKPRRSSVNFIFIAIEFNPKLV